MFGLKEKYQKEIIPKMKEEFGLGNSLAVPKVVKVVVGTGIAKERKDEKAAEEAKKALEAITGQRPKLCRAKKAISSYSLREGEPIGFQVTLRGERMYHFLEKLFVIVLPQVKDFHGLSLRGFDQNGNYNLGLADNLVFPEINYDKIDRPRGVGITIVTNANDVEKSKRLLALLGAPFEKEEKKQ
ncbi:50S ribosomal protein L5 [Candidatus Shapirobacteria bacterium]|nr:50S ribosomal protein L5 [Candidatus Shapirobacteria bacterium]